MTEFQAPQRLPDALPENPMPLAQQWFNAAQEQAQQRNPNSMTLVTVDADGRPDARVVLCKRFVADPGYLVFYTNYESDKGRQLAANPCVAVVMHWDALGRQIRMQGQALRSPADESDAYFSTRGWGSQLGAWGSDQSRPLASHAELVAQIRKRAAALGIELGDDTTTLAADPPPAIPRPPHWGGYRVWLDTIELWAEGADRIHDRARWERTLSSAAGQAFEPGNWRGSRLQP